MLELVLEYAYGSPDPKCQKTELLHCNRSSELAAPYSSDFYR